MNFCEGILVDYGTSILEFSLLDGGDESHTGCKTERADGREVQPVPASGPVVPQADLSGVVTRWALTHYSRCPKAIVLAMQVQREAATLHSRAYHHTVSFLVFETSFGNIELPSEKLF